MKELIKLIAIKGATTKHYLIGAWISLNIILCTGITEETPFLYSVLVLISLAASAWVARKNELPDDEEDV